MPDYLYDNEKLRFDFFINIDLTGEMLSNPIKMYLMCVSQYLYVKWPGYYHNVVCNRINR